MKKRQRLAKHLARAFLVGSFSAASAFAEGSAVLYQPPHDIAEEWGRRIAFVLIGLAAAVILYTLVARRKRLAEPHSKWLLFLGVCVMPFPIMFLGTAVGLEQSKVVDFCNSCHVMDPFVDDMRDLNSDLLAAAHYKHRYIQREHCYRCHTDYGIFGTIEAKVAGLGHIWKESTGSYELPVKMSKPYRYTICLDCHGQAVKFVAEESHGEVLEAILDGEVVCSNCHEDAHPPRAERSSE